MAQALIVIDIQEGLVKENPFNTKNFIINTKAIIQHFRDQNIEEFLSGTLKMKVY